LHYETMVHTKPYSLLTL